MSQLSQLKQQINGIGNDAKSTAQGLSGFKSKFSQSVSQVSSTIGGSAQQVDQRMIQTLQAAEQQAGLRRVPELPRFVWYVTNRTKSPC